MPWQHLAITISDGGISIYPPSDFAEEWAWIKSIIKSVIPSASIEEGLLFSARYIPKSLMPHCPHKISLWNLSECDGILGWLFVQRMGNFGWEVFQVMVDGDRNHYSPGQTYPQATVLMRKNI